VVGAQEGDDRGLGIIARRGGRRADNVTIAGEERLGLGFVGFQSNEIADVLVLVERDNVLGVGTADHVAGEGGRFVALVAGTENDLGRAQLVGKSGKVHPRLEGEGDGISRAAVSRRNRHRELVAVICGENTERQTDVFKVVDAFDALRFGFGFGQRGQKHTGQNCDNGDND
jgi:hypothetical protein